MVIVPGVMADAQTWRPVVDAIDLPNPVITVNRRGRLPSGPLGPDYAVGVEVDDLRHLITSLRQQVHLVGWSYGGLIALEAALVQDEVLSLIAYEPVARPFGTKALAPLRKAAADNDFDQTVELVNTIVSGFATDYVAELRRSPAWPVLRSLARPLAEELAAINDYEPALSRYRQLNVPVTLLLGELNAGQAPYGTAFAAFADALPQARVVTLGGQGHLAHAQAPRQLARAITDAVVHAG
ncbi:alpha/beta fold hydrolase [Mycobacterium deserti]|uniref:Alpha/beta hydrolase n=1 Tax=Mycobacterium deserti TaxID=2978347 RepID=A0ABT2MJS0_9MYCO|nr:alpha/beta hydrolase [Mycobacterium deserti]MCT7661335.1 alpha/beta hydrolase [Mycobacterium deserti]